MGMQSHKAGSLLHPEQFPDSFNNRPQERQNNSGISSYTDEILFHRLFKSFDCELWL